MTQDNWENEGGALLDRGTMNPELYPNALGKKVIEFVRSLGYDENKVTRIELDYHEVHVHTLDLENLGGPDRVESYAWYYQR